MVEIWNLIIEDKHSDVEVQSFTTRDAALNEALSYMDSVSGDWDADKPPRGWEFLAYYGESNVSVRPGELHGATVVAETPEAVIVHVSVGL